MNVIIIEDEKPSARRLKRMLHILGIEAETMLHSVEESIDWFKNNTHPDLIFLDIQLSDGLSFEIFESIDIKSAIIFTTAYDEYALKAFKLNSIDYLLKPIDSDELTKAVDRFKTSFRKDKAYDSLLTKAVNNDMRETKKTLLIKTTQEQHVLVIDDIIRCQSDGSYTTFYTADKKIMSARNLKYYESMLNDTAFIRVHQSHLINSNYIDTMALNTIVLKDGEKVPVSSRKKSAIKQFLSEL